MGLTSASTGSHLLSEEWNHGDGAQRICLAGNPNVGKSTIFNTLTGLKQHTGNWSGKTVGIACGRMQRHREILLVDLPGMYSMEAQSEEEKAAADFLKKESPMVVIVASASALERSLSLMLEILEAAPRAFLCVNLMDEARRMGIGLDLERLEERLKIPVVGVSSGNGEGMRALEERLTEWAANPVSCILPLPKTERDRREYAKEITEEICQGKGRILSERADRILTSKYMALPLILLFLAGIFWITMVGANIPSEFLAWSFQRIGSRMDRLFDGLGVWGPLHSLLMDGIWNTLSWIVAVMLPPMAIFFPLFTFLEDVGYLPRLAFNLDRPFQCCGSCGKQALPMCMGFGCNAAGVVGCRIIRSPRERLLAVVTNSLVPCNGRFPFLAVMAGLLSLIWMDGNGIFAAMMVLSAILLGVLVTFLVTGLLSKTVLKGMPSSFVLELPPYRMPKLRQILVRSLLDRTICVLGRAAAIAVPAGVLLWLLANLSIGEQTVLKYCTSFLDPLGKWMGVDGTILMGFLLGMPANEIVLPIILMGYMGTGVMSQSSTAVMEQVLLNNGWTALTVMNVMILCLFHCPCTTTLISIYRETGSRRWTVLAAVIPILLGIGMCILTRLLFSIM